MKSTRILLLATLALICLPVVSAQGQDAVALIGEGTTPDGLPAGAVVTGINNPGTNSQGGWAFNGNYDGPDGTISFIWGNLMGGPGSLIREEGYFAPYTQTSFESFWGMGLDAVSYSPSCTEDGGSTGLDGVWVNDRPVAVEEMVYPHLEGYYFSFGSRPSCTEDGVPYFVGGITNNQGGSTQLRGLFYGDDTRSLMMTGDVLPNLPAPLLGSGAISFDYRISDYGTHHIAEVLVDVGSSASDGAMVLDGEGLLLDGSLVREGTPVPVAVGGQDGENWDNFDYCAITEDGRYLFTGDTDRTSDKDEFLLIDGQMVLREGHMVGDYVLSGSIEGAFMNENGDWAVIWDVDLPTGENVEALIYNGELLLKEGDIIDTDGDGVPEPGSTVDAFTGIASLLVGEPDADGNVTLFFTADVNIEERGTVQGPGTISADPELGLDEDLVLDGSTRAVVEFGYGLTIGGAVPAMLGDMDIVAGQRGVALSWQLRGAAAGTRMILRAAADGRVWEVPCSTAGDGRFSAFDQGAFGGEVTYSLYLIDVAGNEQMLGEKVYSLETPRARLVLDGAYPNPFNPETKILFRVGDPQQLQVAVYDVAGNLVRVLADEVFGMGVHEVTWNGRDRSGAAVPSGTYFARVVGGTEVQTSKLQLVK